MTIKDLYAVCDNLDHNSWFEIRKTYPIPGDVGVRIDEGKYMELHAKWSDHRIKGFKVSDNGRDCTIFI